MSCELHNFHLWPVQGVTASGQTSSPVLAIVDTPQALCRVLCADEEVVTISGVRNSSKLHVCPQANPHATYYQALLIPAKICSVNFWVSDYVIGPHAILNLLGRAHYADFLEQTVPLFLEDMPQYVCESIRFHYRCAPPNFVWWVQLAWQLSGLMDWLRVEVRLRGLQGLLIWILQTFVSRCLREKVCATEYRESEDLINLLKPNGYMCTIDFIILILCITPTKCICKFDMILTINSCSFPK
jgi:hypothetical protein